jgi:UDP-N-acetylglucosamine acyltransferase
MANIHATAIVEPGAALADDVEIGAYSIVRGKVKIGAGTIVGPHCVIEGRTTIGAANRISQFNSIGGVPQDKKYAGEDTRLEIGDRNTIREFCTINVGTAQDAGVTRIGDDNWIMNCVHIAHDCQVGSQTIIAGYSGLAGHVQLGDWAIVGGMSGLLQFVRVGAHAAIWRAHAPACSERWCSRRTSLPRRRCWRRWTPSADELVPVTATPRRRVGRPPTRQLQSPPPLPMVRRRP